MYGAPPQLPRARSCHRAVALAMTMLLVPLLGAARADAVPRAKRKKAMAYFDRGARSYKAGHYKKAAPLFLRAWSADPKPEYLFNAARAEHRGGMLDKAHEHYQRCLGIASAPRAIRERSKKHLAEVQELLEAAARKEAARQKALDAKAGQNAAPKMPQVHAQAPGSWRGPVGWVALGSGVVAGGLGAWLLWEHGDGQAALNLELDKLNSQGLIVGTDYLTYEAEQKRLNGDRRLGLASVAAGATLAAVGGWLLWTEPDRAALSISPGPALALNARF